MKLARIDPKRLEPLIAEAKRLAAAMNVSPEENLKAAMRRCDLEERKKAEEKYLEVQVISRVVWIVFYLVCAAMGLFFLNSYQILTQKRWLAYSLVCFVGLILVGFARSLQRPSLIAVLSGIAERFPMDDDEDYGE